MGLFKKRATDPAEMERLRSEIASMSARLDAADAAKQELGEQVQGIVTRLETPITPPPAPPVLPVPPAPPSPPQPVVDPAELDMLRARIQRLSDRMEQIDGRITAISTELANQITELGREIEAVADREPPADVTPIAEELVGELRDAQTRLANEQARYQIAFRQDLAELADRLRRS